VALTLSFDNGNFDFKCLPVHALLISYFDETSKRKLSKINSELNENGAISSEFLSKEI
jgi:hypothetical protein